MTGVLLRNGDEKAIPLPRHYTVMLAQFRVYQRPV